MNTKPKILFRGFEGIYREIGFGDVFEYSAICYIKGKDLGYDNIHIVFPIMGGKGKQHLTEKSYYWQPSKFLPWTWHPRNKQINSDDWDYIINTREPNSLFDGFVGLAPVFHNLLQYSDIFYSEKNIPPYLHLERNYIETPYILFHYASAYTGSYKSEFKHTNNKQFVDSFNIIKELFGKKYKYWKIGDKSPIDNQFDKVIPQMYDKIDDFFRIVYNSSLMIASHSAPLAISNYVPKLPVIVISAYYDACSWMPDSWENSHPAFKRDKRSPKHPSWCDDTLLTFFKGSSIDRKLITDFLKRFKLI